jgi:hypothetical protein
MFPWQVPEKFKTAILFAREQRQSPLFSATLKQRELIVISKADTPIDNLGDERVKLGESWLSLFFWPALRRVFLPAAKLQVTQQTTHPKSRQSATNSKKQKVLEFPVPKVIIDAQIESWIRWTLESNIDLAAALRRLRNSYLLIQAGKPAKDATEILAQVEAALQYAEKSKT